MRKETRVEWLERLGRRNEAFDAFVVLGAGETQNPQPLLCLTGHLSKIQRVALAPPGAAQDTEPGSPPSYTPTRAPEEQSSPELRLALAKQACVSVALHF